jgi:hypothetical protein
LSADIELLGFAWELQWTSLECHRNAGRTRLEMRRTAEAMCADA